MAEEGKTTTEHPHRAHRGTEFTESGKEIRVVGGSITNDCPSGVKSLARLCVLCASVCSVVVFSSFSAEAAQFE
jgi:hypothetical protein